MAEPIHATTAAAAAQSALAHWSVVLRVADDNSWAVTDAPGEPCRVCWFPLYAFARRCGCRRAEAGDLTQAFLPRLLERNAVARAGSTKGCFRTVLLTLSKRFLANEWNREHAQKRGGFQRFLSIESQLAGSRLGAEPARKEQPDIRFDRRWAMTVLDQVMKRLEEEYKGSGRGPLLEHLQGCLVRDAAVLPYAEIASRLNLSEAAVKMAMQRLRARYLALLREEIGKTVASSESVEPEPRDLFEAFRH